jgi:hypothetical protein
MRALLVSALLALPLSGQAGSLNQYFDKELDVPIQLSSGVVLTLRTLELVGEDLGRRLVLKAEIDEPRPPSTDPTQLALEGREAKELCQRHLAELVSYLPELPSRRITHLDVLYRDTKTHFKIDIHSLRGMRVDTARSACTGA